MTVDESLAVLRANLGYSPEEREHAYAVAREGILLEISTAPTPALKARYQRKLSELEAANAAAKTVSGANLPKTVSGSTNPSPEPAAAAPAVIPESLPSPHVIAPHVDPLPTASHPVETTRRKRLIVVGAGVLALLIILALVNLTGSNPAKPQVKNVPATGSPSGRDDIGSVDSQPKTLAVTTERQNYQNGEDVVCLVDIPFDGYLRVYSIDVVGEKTQIFPNGFEPNGKVLSGTHVRIPGNSEYTLKLGLPAGSNGGDESVVAVLSPTPFEDGSAPNANTPFPSVEASTNLKTRGLSAQAVGNTANGAGSYRVSP
jgi:hypothetical protein